MKRLMIIIMAIMAMATVNAQDFPSNEDYVTISSVVPNYWDKSQSKLIDLRLYLEATTSGISTQRNVSDGCLWQLETNANGYALKNVSTGLYLGTSTRDNNNFSLVLNQSPTFFRIDVTNGNSASWLHGTLYYQYTLSHGNWTEMVNVMVGREHNEPFRFIASRYNAYTALEIELWEKKGGGDATSHFNPDKAVFEYAAEDAAAQEQKAKVRFVLEASSESYYQCVPRDEMLIGRQSEALDPSKVDNVQVYWMSSKGNTSTINLADYSKKDETETENRILMTLSQITREGNDWHFFITPNGKSPMGLMQHLLKETVGGNEVYTEEYVDYVDWVVVSYTYEGKSFTQQMRVVRKAYHKEKLPTLVLTINPLTYTFAKGEEEKEFEIKAIHQHGTVIYSVENIAIGNPVYEDGYTPTKVELTNENLTLELSDKWNDQLTAQLSDGKIKVRTKENTTEAKRSSVLTGTLCPVKEVDANHPCETFTINLHQRYENVGIQLIPNKGKGDVKLQTNQYDDREEQAVHTAERTIYYDSETAIELRLPESGYSGYMRWYDYETNGAPNYNHCHDGKISTAWDFAPQSASGKAFAAINTPTNKDAAENSDGYSLGLYALNKSARGSNGSTLTAAILDEDKNDNPAPRIRPWSDNGYHIMACDVSAYTDYTIEVENGQIKSITEPTLSYRQLFHMRPASAMADRFAALKENEFLETYSYQAPAGKRVLLATEYRFHQYRSHISEMCYFYYDKTTAIKRITNQTPVVWTEYTLQNDGTYGGARTFTPNYTAALDYLIVQEDRYPVQKKYTLTVPKDKANTDRDLLIASFEVQFLDIEKYGPTEKTIITQQRIESDYKLLANINFDNYDSNDKHLPWDYTSYGYVYDVEPLNTNAGYKRGASQGVFPFYGEYTVLASVSKDWANSLAHSGKALYVDGTMEPGLVATISAPTNICSGQTVYCSAWFRNPRPNNSWAAGGNTANPIFRCNIQGRKDNGDWEDAGVYFVGELAIGSGWQQIVFPIESAHSYDETRVSIYNFATTNQGNDFMVDDINLYVSQLPIAAYQGKMACRSDGGEHTRAAAILRLDYTNINTGDARYMYYQIFNETMCKDVNLTGDVAYFHEAPGEHDHTNFGSVGIPDVSFDPGVYNDEQKKAGKDTLKIYYSISKLLDDMVANNWHHAKAYIKTENSGAVKWLLYVAHLIEQVTDQTDGWNDEVAQTLPLEKLFDQHRYVMRMAYTPTELPAADCNLTTPIHATQQTVFTLRNSNKETIKHSQDTDGTLFAGNSSNDNVQYIYKQSYNNCANDLYFLTSTVVNHLAVDIGKLPADISAPIYSDWLVGDPKGDVLSETPPSMDNVEAYKEYLERMQTSINEFEKTYGYTHGQVSHAIMYDMRRFATDDPKSPEYNPNYYAKTFEELDPTAFESLQNYEIIRHLYENEWLHLYDTTVHFYLGSQETARYWCFPIKGTAKTKMIVEGEEQEITLKDCNEPHRVMVNSCASDHQFNMAPITNADKTPQEKLQIPSVKVLADEQNNITSVTFPITEISEDVQIDGNAPGENITINLSSNLPNYISFFSLETGETIDKPSKFDIGKEYTIRLAYQKNGGDYWLDGENTSCRVGYIFFTLQVVPNILVWQNYDATFNGWGKNENWRGWIDDNGDGVIDEGELTNGFVPMEGSNVVIPNLGNAMVYPYIVPEHEHDHYRMAVHHDQHRCKNIYFEAGARIENQHLLNYERAYVDMQITAGKWNMMSAPLQKMVSGDMFIPHTGKYYDDGAGLIAEPNPFKVESFQGLRHRDAAYLFYQHFYNQTVSTHYEDGGYTSAASIGFEESNSLSQPLQPGGGYSLYGVGKTGGETLTIRLPKPDAQYQYYTSTGEASDQYASVDRGEENDAYKFAFTASHDNPNMEITLTNDIASHNFIFGNPTMAYIDMQRFLEANKDVLNPVFHRIEASTWTASTELTMIQDRYLAPMASVMLETNDPEKMNDNITVNLSASHLTLNNMINSVTEQPSKMPQRVITSSSTRAIDSEILTIYALTPKAIARTVLATNPVAEDYYQVGEDAIFVSSGIENNTSVKSPLNMYTVAEQVPMMADVRQGISNIPVAILAADNARSEYMQVAFYYTSNWSRECYFVDHKTGQKIRIMDGLVISVEMPENHEQRYYIEGPDTYQGSDGVTTSTTQPTLSTTGNKVWAYAPDRGNVVVSSTDLIKSATLYDITGRLITLSPLNSHLMTNTLTLHTAGVAGVYIVDVTLRDGSTERAQVIVQ